MITYVDTSAFIALIDADSSVHETARRIWARLLSQDDMPITCSYVVVETCALLHHRFGLGAVRLFLEKMLPATIVHWVDVPTHDSGTNGLLMSSRKGPNIVDCVSFAVMRALGVTEAFTFDAHFEKQGFTLSAP